jgi:hypothetical protein
MCQSSNPGKEVIVVPIARKRTLARWILRKHRHVSRRIADLMRCHSPNDAGNYMDRLDLVLDSISAALSSQISCSAAIDLIFRYCHRSPGLFMFYFFTLRIVIHL